jgi:hypothetical protein
MLNSISFKGSTYMYYTHPELYQTLKCKYSDCIPAMLALPYFLLLYITLCLFLYVILCYAIDVFYILLGDDPMLYGSIEQNK